MITYQTNDPKGWMGDPARGAALGRHAILSADRAAPVQITLQAVHIDSQGYDTNGTYFGSLDRGEMMFWYADEAGEIDAMLRLPSIQAARAAILADYPQAVITLSAGDVAGMLDAYMECALWSSHDESDDSGGNPMDANYTTADIAEEPRAEMERDCTSFMTDNAALLAQAFEQHGYDLSRAGHDFWLTRNGHGVGFDDRDLGEIGDALHKAAQAFGETDLYVGDDGQIYSM